MEGAAGMKIEESEVDLSEVESASDSETVCNAFFLAIVLILSNDNKRTFIVFSHEVIYFLFICLIKWRKISYSYISCDFSHQLWKVQLA